MNLRALRVLALAGLLLPTAAEARRMGVYDYPFVSPLAATVAATPPANRAVMPTDIEISVLAENRFLRVFPDRAVPEVFWYFGRGLPYALYRQPDRRAPLFFVIGGTGAGYDATKTRVMVRALYQAGFHVVSLPNPTHSSFIVTASEDGVPGRLKEDAADLYRAMRMIAEELEGQVEVDGYYLGGYSLGGTHAAFVSWLDDQEGRLGFEKALVINPPVSLFNSVGILDDMLDRHLRADPQGVSGLIDRIFAQMTELYDVRERIDFSDPNFIYRAYTLLEPPERELEVLIGLAFRLTSNDMGFTSDVMTNAGYVVPKDAQLTATTSLTDVFLQGMGLRFIDFFQDVYVPFAIDRRPEVTREELIREASLYAIDGYLRRAERVVMLGTADDVILAPGEIDYLEDVFGERARIFPTGGHCGSMDQREFVAAMLELLAD